MILSVVQSDAECEFEILTWVWHVSVESTFLIVVISPHRISIRLWSWVNEG